MFKFHFLLSGSIRFNQSKIYLFAHSMNLILQIVKFKWKLLNHMINVTTVRYRVEDYVQWNFKTNIQKAVLEEDLSTSSHFSYQWKSPSTGSSVFSFTRRGDLFYADKKGFTFGYQTTIDNFTGGKCGPQLPTTPNDVKLFGGAQSFVSHTFYENLLTAAIQRCTLDTILNKTLWQTSDFNYTAKDLSKFIGNLEAFPADTPVNGKCSADPFRIDVSTGGFQQLKVKLKWYCNLSIGGISIIGIIYSGDLQVQEKVNKNGEAFDYWVIDTSQKQILLGQSEKFPIIDHGRLMKNINETIDRLRQTKVFGSGFPLYFKRKNLNILESKDQYSIHFGSFMNV